MIVEAPLTEGALPLARRCWWRLPAALQASCRSTRNASVPTSARRSPRSGVHGRGFGKGPRRRGGLLRRQGDQAAESGARCRPRSMAAGAGGGTRGSGSPVAGGADRLWTATDRHGRRAAPYPRSDLTGIQFLRTALRRRSSASPLTSSTGPSSEASSPWPESNTEAAPTS